MNDNKLNSIGFYTMYDERVSKVSATSQMKRCELIITEYCNFKCPYCRGLADYIYGNRKIKQLTFKEICYIIDQWCKLEPLESIRFSGGEPTLHPDIVDVIKYAKAKGIKNIAISTNGSSPQELYDQLLEAGVNDCSISLDACCAEDGDHMAGDKKGAWDILTKNIAYIAKKCYVTVGVVLTPENVDKTIDTVRFAHTLGVADIRIISAAQWNQPIPRLNEIEQEILEAHPILKYRVGHFANGVNVRGISDTDSKRCSLGYDDAIVAGEYAFPCIIYMREGGKPICKVGDDMRERKIEWLKTHNTHLDPICKKNCLDVCCQYNNKYRDVHGEQA